jgi:hypothetical protein
VSDPIPQESPRPYVEGRPTSLCKFCSIRVYWDGDSLLRDASTTQLHTCIIEAADEEIPS